MAFIAPLASAIFGTIGSAVAGATVGALGAAGSVALGTAAGVVGTGLVGRAALKATGKLLTPKIPGAAPTPRLAAAAAPKKAAAQRPNPFGGTIKTTPTGVPKEGEIKRKELLGA